MTTDTAAPPRLHDKLTGLPFVQSITLPDPIRALDEKAAPLPVHVLTGPVEFDGVPVRSVSSFDFGDEPVINSYAGFDIRVSRNDGTRVTFWAHPDLVTPPATFADGIPGCATVAGFPFMVPPDEWTLEEVVSNFEETETGEYVRCTVYVGEVVVR